MNYIKTYHCETAQYMQGCFWTGGLVSTYPGTTTYKYTSGNGWTVTITNPVVNNPLYSVTVTYEKQAYLYSPTKVVVNWQGTWQNDAIRQTYYRYTP
jgi:hypothetical protein